MGFIVLLNCRKGTQSKMSCCAFTNCGTHGPNSPYCMLCGYIMEQVYDDKSETVQELKVTIKLQMSYVTRHLNPSNLDNPAQHKNLTIIIKHQDNCFRSSSLSCCYQHNFCKCIVLHIIFCQGIDNKNLLSCSVYYRFTNF